MTMAERNACKPFRWDDVADSDSDWESEDECFLTQFEKSKKRKEREYLGHSDYINCEFVLGNGAVVESLWSVFESFNDKRRRGSSPITNEMILFLRDNKDLWGIEDVHKANDNQKASSKNERVEKKIAEHNDFMKELEDAIDNFYLM